MTAASGASPGARFRAAVAEERPLQVVGAINAYCRANGGRLRLQSAVSLGRRRRRQLAGRSGSRHQHHGRRADRHPPHHRCLPVAAAGGCRYRVGRRLQHRAHREVLHQGGAAGLHIEDQVQAKRCGHRPGKEIVSKQEMVDRVKAAVDARTEPEFVIMARTDALAVEGIDKAIERAVACVEAGADMIFPEAVTELPMYRRFKKTRSRCRFSPISRNSARRPCTRARSWARSASTSCCIAARPIGR